MVGVPTQVVAENVTLLQSAVWLGHVQAWHSVLVSTNVSFTAS